MTGVRRLLIGSMANMRELGGYATLDGHVTRFGRFIRSDAPVSLSGEDIDFLRQYGVRLSIDLRFERETREAPSSLKDVPGIAYRSISFSDDISLMGATAFSPRTHYVPMMQGQNRIREVFSAMAACEEGAVLFHCSAGKDRTGVIAALLLHLARVPEADITADYQVTYTYIREMVDGELRNRGYPVDDMPMEAFRSDAEWIDPLLRYVAQCGGPEAYLTGIGVEHGEIEAIRERLVSA